MGNDRTVCLALVDGRVVDVQSWRRAMPEKIVVQALTMAAKWGVPQENIQFDAIGGVGGSLKRAFEVARVPAWPVYMGGEVKDDWRYLFGKDAHLHFINRRAELHWTMRLLFENRLISMDPSFYPLFVVESCQLVYGFLDTGKLYIESKDKKYKPRTGFSPDHNDALVLSLARDRIHFAGMSGGDIPSRKEHKLQFPR